MALPIIYTVPIVQWYKQPVEMLLYFSIDELKNALQYTICVTRGKTSAIPKVMTFNRILRYILEVLYIWYGTIRINTIISIYIDSLNIILVIVLETTY